MVPTPSPTFVTALAVAALVGGFCAAEVPKTQTNFNAGPTTLNPNYAKAYKPKSTPQP